MENHFVERRSFLKKMTALGAAGVPIVGDLAPRTAHAAYDPAAKFDLKVSEGEFRRNAAGRTLMARIYQPQGKGPFPALLDLHGGAWNNKDRRAEEPMDRAIAASGVLVVAIDMTLAPDVDATLAYVATRSPISNTFARFQNAEEKKRENMMKNNKTFFVPWETIHEAHPQEILERREQVTLVPLLIMQGALDDNVLPAVQEKFAATYRAAGGQVDFHVFPGSEHEWVAKPGPQTDRARGMVKAFIERNLKGGSRTV